ncbi:MAG TPA: LuxR C-terminal-related transcriptional regulator [Amycolatopsis sp.]|uniref:helix-turn-helix transcriptional regulator n=1 Tax=Amycolatopsis sp. TaxID=37632 RepID=UPI002B4A1D84|nr:LuxR C-terminal-related transcriptional regulator [Amycolatopsis sp.]HKS47430.1 LuxR C-terminal-related transcriptional regulator [Amycolatopsis sp.]
MRLSEASIAVAAGADARLLADIKLLIVEEQEVIRRGLLAITSSMPKVTASAVASVSAGLEMAAGADVTLVSAATLTSAERAGVAVEGLHPLIVVVPTAQPGQLEIATRWRASGYIMQGELTSRSLHATLRQVMDGQLAVPDAIASYLLGRAQGSGTVPLPRLNHLNHLSPRETEVLTLLVAGASNKEIASRLGISIHGVKRHVSTLLNQFHSPNRVHLVSHILRSGVLAWPD